MNFEDRIKKLIAAHLELSPEEVRPEARFMEDLGADSLDVVELVMALEDEFKISIPDEDIETIKNVRDAVNYLRRQTGSGN